MTRRRLDMDLAYQECRLFGHQWDRFNPGVGQRRQKWGNRIHVRCARCATEREWIFNVYGTLESVNYKYPDGYTVARDDRPDNDRLRVSVTSLWDDGLTADLPKPPKRQHLDAGKRARPRAAQRRQRAHT